MRWSRWPLRETASTHFCVATTFPVPDLIPPSILVRRAVRKAKRMVAIAMIGVLSVLALLFVVGRIQLASATAELATARAAAAERGG